MVSKVCIKSDPEAFTLSMGISLSVFASQREGVSKHGIDLFMIRISIQHLSLYPWNWWDGSLRERGRDV